jgi:hypothetical protein
MTHSPLLLCSIGVRNLYEKKSSNMLNLGLRNAGSIWVEPEGKNIIYSQVYVLQGRGFPGFALGPARFHAHYHTDNAKYAAIAALTTNLVVHF